MFTGCVAKIYLNIIAFLKSHFVNSVDPDLKKPADQDLHCFFQAVYALFEN